MTIPLGSLADLIKQYPWGHWLTLEFPPPWALVDTGSAFQRLQAFVDSFTRETQGPVAWFAVAERHADGRIHLHVFTRGTAGLSLERLKDRWVQRNGGAHVALYIPHAGAAEYSVKDIHEGLAEWQFSEGFTRAMQKLDRIAARCSDG